jgi:hypothetical protein
MFRILDNFPIDQVQIRLKNNLPPDKSTKVKLIESEQSRIADL